MAANSPAISNNSADTNSVIASAANNNNNNSNSNSKTSRGLNKPKCIKCGNVARSRCPYQACKSCCAKDQNPCHIHVLKGGTSLPEKAPTSAPPRVEQQSTDPPPSVNPLRVSSIRQLSSNFAQFNNLLSPARTRKPVTIKDATLLNEWRSSKIKEYKDRNIEAENEAFDRYVQNVSLLEEVFGMKPGSTAENGENLISRMKLKLKLDPIRSENFREKLKFIVNNGLRNLKKLETQDVANDVHEESELVRRVKKAKCSRTDRISALQELDEKLSKARTEDDLKACREIKSEIFNGWKQTCIGSTVQPNASEQRDDGMDASHQQKSKYSLPKWSSTGTIDQEGLSRIDARFCSLDAIEQL